MESILDIIDTKALSDDEEPQEGGILTIDQLKI